MVGRGGVESDPGCSVLGDSVLGARLLDDWMLVVGCWLFGFGWRISEE